mmetsp:Transcript_26555/g.48015  ORF Transcript_26555/g.48015 Transcript_26555/m.48015 type:complete len:595 (+) Transcript_26555:53-1837(+)
MESFFGALPEDEFEHFENELRQALLSAASRAQEHGLPGGRFPLHAWIDRRLGGEVRTSRDSKAQCEIALVKQDAPHTLGEEGQYDEAFFSSLGDDNFSQEEEILRDSIFNFLASWKHAELANLNHLCADPKIRVFRQKLLPAHVPLEHWIERRIGAEVEVQKDAAGNDIIHVTPEARQIVTAKFQALQQQQKAPQMMPQPLAPPAFPVTPAMGGAPMFQAPANGIKGGGKGQVSKGLPPVQSKEQWLQSLPADELNGEEAALRQALLDFLATWPQRRPKQKPPGSSPNIGEAAADPEVGRCRAALLPSNVPLREWVDSRIGGEIEIQTDKFGMGLMTLRGQEPAHAVLPDPSQGSSVEDFLDSLPDDALKEEELGLRQAVIDLVARGPQPIGQLGKNAAVVAARRFLPPEIQIRAWIERRIGGEVEIAQDHRGFSCIQIRGAQTESKGDAKAAGKGGGGKSKASKGAKGGEGSSQTAQDFWKSLPSDNFTAGEEALRDAILCFMENWTEEELPGLSKAMLDHNVRRCKVDVLPKNNSVSLKEWIERRLGAELEILRNAQGMLVIGIRGETPPDAVKRELEADDIENGTGKKRRI